MTIIYIIVLQLVCWTSFVIADAPSCHIDLFWHPEMYVVIGCTEFAIDIFTDSILCYYFQVQLIHFNDVQVSWQVFASRFLSAIVVGDGRETFDVGL